MSYRFSKAALGGTFDHLHRGHKHLLETAAGAAKQLVIGLTSDAMVSKKKWVGLIEPYSVRERELRSALNRMKLQDRAEIIPLSDIYGTTLSDPTIEGLVVTEHTRAGADTINGERIRRKLQSLPIVVADLVKDQAGEYISSTRIRGGAIDREGFVYGQLFATDYVFSPAQRKACAVVQDRLATSLTATDLSGYTAITLVGDVVTETFLSQQLPFNYAIVDGMNDRKPADKISWQPDWITTAHNPPGGVTHEAAGAIGQLLTHDQGLLIIDGEEDLLGFPAVLLSPLSSMVIYGQPKQGMVMIEVSEEKKAALVAFLKGKQ